MYWFDTVLLLLLGASALAGAWFGFVGQLARILCVGLAVYAAVLLHEPAALFLQDCLLRGASSQVIDAVAYSVVFCVSFLLLHYAARLIRNLVHEADLDGYDRLLGALLGLAKMGLALGVVCLGMTNYRHPSTQEILDRSKLIDFFADHMERIVIMVPEEYKDRLKGTIFHIRDEVIGWK